MRVVAVVFLLVASLAVGCAKPPPAAAPKPARPEASPPVAQPAPQPAPTPEPVVEPAKPVVQKPDPATPPADPTVTIVAVGDVGLNRSGLPVRAEGIAQGKGHQAWADTTKTIAEQVDGDLNFLNLETVVSADNKLKKDTKNQNKPFNFMTHPNGVRHLVKLGFNLISLANNHSMDFGREGLLDTLKHMRTMGSDGLLAYAGVGMDRNEASKPHPVEVKGHKVLFSALGIVTNMLGRHRVGENKPGQMAYRYDADWETSTKRLSEAHGAYRILSIHYGYERKVRPDYKQYKQWRRHAARKLGIDLLIGHHAHVVRPVEINGNSIIFYGLGNFLHRGTRNMAGPAKFRLCRDYGILARVHLVPDAAKKLRPRAIEVVPVTNMHYQTKVFSDVAQSHKRVEVLNYLAGLVDNAKEGAVGVRFRPQANGSGLYCYQGADKTAGKVGQLCRNWRPADPPSADLRREIVRACQVLKEKADTPKSKRGKKRKAKRSKRGGKRKKARRKRRR